MSYEPNLYTDGPYPMKKHSYVKGGILFAAAILSIVLLSFIFAADLYAQTLGTTSAAGAASQSGASAGFQYTDSRSYTTHSRGSDLGDHVPNLWVPGPGGGGANPCVVTIGAGGVGSGFGLGFSRAYNDHECQIREAMRMMGGQINPKAPEAQRVMKNVACQSDIYQEAFRRSGSRCANDPVRRAQKVSTTSAPVATTDQAAAYSACKKVSDRDYGDCMRRASDL